MNRHAAGPADRGFSLIEVIVALALLAAVLLTISGLFVQGGQSVNTGRDLTEATSLATSILEEMDKWAFTQLYTNFCTSGGAAHVNTDGEFSFQTDWTNCSIFNATRAGGQNGASGVISWQQAIRQRLPNSKATITVTPMGSTNNHFDTAKGIRVKVTVDWTLRLMSRQVSLETVRF